MDNFGIVVLAAGKGTRLNLDLPKPLISLMGKTLIDFPLRAASRFLDHAGTLTVVVETADNRVEEFVSTHYPKVKIARQAKPLGTADAVKAYFDSNPAFKDFKYTVILCADTPLIQENVLQSLLEPLESENNLLATAAVFKASDPTGLGRIVRGKQGFSIVEEKEASDEQRLIDEVNSGIYIVETTYLLSVLKKVNADNRGKEFYLTDIFQEDRPVKAVLFEDDKLFYGVNTLVELERAEGLLRRRKILRLQESGVHFIDSRHTYLEEDVVVLPGTRIHPHVFLKGQTSVGENCVLENGCVISDSQIAKETVVKAYSYLEGVVVGENCAIGPFARLREGTHVSSQCKIGNFVETKKAQLREKVSVSHLSYIGDAEIGDSTNIGCGFITCNYDGEKKHKTIIGKNNFIGSDTQMIAPVQTGDFCYIASGSTINKDLPRESFAIARSRQTTKQGMAKKFLKGKYKSGDNL